MKQELTFLNSKDIKKISKTMHETFEISLDKTFAYAMNKEGKIFMISKRVADIGSAKLRTTHVGLYIAKEEKGLIRLSIDATHFFKPQKNVLELSKSEMEAWMKGENIEKAASLKGVVVLKYKNDFVGCGKISNNMVYNFLPKERRVYDLH